MSQQERQTLDLTGVAVPVVALWMATAFCAALGLAVLVLAALGTETHGTVVALKVTARFSFLLFWPAYTATALTTLFGAAFEPLKRHGREFGLAFAAAHLVHLGLIAWLTYIGAAPAARVFVFFGIAALWTYLIALFSIPRLHRALGSTGWRVLRVVGLNYIAFAFAKDFLRDPHLGAFEYLAAYLPFVVLSVVGPLLVITAFIRRANS